MPVSGRIDRLAVVGREVLIADFKTTRPPWPDEPTPGADGAQLALYGRLAREIWPAHRVRHFLVWTAGPTVRELTDTECRDALARIAETAVPP